MPIYNPCFFSAHDSGEHIHGVKYERMVRTSSDVDVLYRGLEDAPTTLCHLSTIMLGIFGHRLPEVVRMHQISQHKLTNLKNDAHMLSLTTDRGIAADWGQNRFITIDPSLLRSYLIDVNKTSSYHQWNFPGRMEKEKEHVLLGVLSCNVKNIVVGDKIIPNPFYIMIDETQEDVIESFKSLYLDYLCMLRKIKEKKYHAESLKQMVSKFITAYLSFYDNYAGENNPFNKSIHQLREDFPGFIKRLVLVSKIETLDVPFRELIIKQQNDLLKQHVYAKSLLHAKPFREEEVVTVYDDPYSYGGNFD